MENWFYQLSERYVRSSGRFLTRHVQISTMCAQSGLKHWTHVGCPHWVNVPLLICSTLAQRRPSLQLKQKRIGCLLHFILKTKLLLSHIYICQRNYSFSYTTCNYQSPLQTSFSQYHFLLTSDNGTLKLERYTQ